MTEPGIPEEPLDPAVLVDQLIDPQHPELIQQASLLINQVGLLSDAMIKTSGALAVSNEAIQHSNERIIQINQYGKKNRRLIHALGWSIVVDLLLSIGLAFAINQSHDATENATRAAASAAEASANNATTIKNTCLASNETRKSNIQLWNYLFNLAPPTAPPSPAVVDFKAFVEKTFAPRDCG